MKSPKIGLAGSIVLGAVALCSSFAATTRPFTIGADAVTAVGIAGVVCGALAITARRRRGASRTPGGVAEGHKATITVAAPNLRSRGTLVWASFVVVVIAFELVNFALLPRYAHPTLSSMLGVITSHEVSRGLLFAAWLGLGMWLAGGQ